MGHLAANTSSGNSAARVVALLFALTVLGLMYYIPTIVAVIRMSRGAPASGLYAILRAFRLLEISSDTLGRDVRPCQIVAPLVTVTCGHASVTFDERPRSGDVGR
jgi:hypothetical protein